MRLELAVWRYKWQLLLLQLLLLRMHSQYCLPQKLISATGYWQRVVCSCGTIRNSGSSISGAAAGAVESAPRCRVL